MKYTVHYYSDDVKAEIAALPVNLKARYISLSSRRQIIMLHSFIKKSDKTPLKERRLAERRLKDMKNANT